MFPEIGIDYGFFGRDREDVLSILCVKCRNSSTGCLVVTAVDRKGAPDCASSYLPALITRLRSRSGGGSEFFREFGGSEHGDHNDGCEDDSCHSRGC